METPVTNGTNTHSDEQHNIYTFEVVKGIAEWLLERTQIRPKIGVICGSGLGTLADLLTETCIFKYEDIPYFPRSTVPGHVGRLVFGYLGDAQVVCMQGRTHFYEGYPLWKVTMPVRVMKLCGITHLVCSNAAGGLNPDYNVGDIMIVKDHVNFMGFAGNNPLMGYNDERFGPRFIAMNKAYDQSLRSKAKKLADEMGMKNIVREGVLVALGGPNFETVAELKMLRTCGVDAVGMSTVAEVLTGHHAGLVTFAFSLITNKCVVDYESHDEPEHEEVLEAARSREAVLKQWISAIAQYINTTS